MILDESIQGESIGKEEKTSEDRATPHIEVSWWEQTNRIFKMCQWGRIKRQWYLQAKWSKMSNVWDTNVELGIWSKTEAKNIVREEVKKPEYYEDCFLWILQSPRILRITLERVTVSQAWKISKEHGGEAGANIGLQISTVWRHQLAIQVK